MLSSLWTSAPQEPPFTSEELSERTSKALADVRDALIGINLLLDDRFDAAERRLANPATPFHGLARGFTVFVIALVGFEDEYVDQGLKQLNDAESMAAKLSKDVKKRIVSKSDTTGLELDIIQADCDMMVAVLYFLKEGMMDYARAVLRLRHAYATFEAAYKTLHAADKVPDPSGEAFVASKTVIETEAALDDSSKDKRSMDALIEGGVHFGRGLFSLILSILPPKPAKALSVLGYQGSRSTGLAHLRACVRASSDDVHAPLAALALLTYHTGLSAFATYEPRVQEALKECEELIKEMRSKFPHGRMWQLFQGRVLKMRGDLDGALELFGHEESSKTRKETKDGESDPGETIDTTAVDDQSTTKVAEDDLDILGEDFGSPNTKHLIQLEHLMEYEYAWCLILTEQYLPAADIFHHLANNTNWSRAFYTYIQASCLYAACLHEDAQKQRSLIPVMLQKRFGGMIPVEKYANRKALQLAEVPPADDVPYTGAVLELAYVWNAFRQLPRSRLQRVCLHAEDLSRQARTIDEHAVANLLRGAAHRQLGEYNTARKYLSRVLELEADCTGDRHTMPYAWLELATIACENGGKWEEAEMLVKKVRDYPSSYDFENRIQLRVSLLKESIIEGRKRTGQWPPPPKKK